MRGAGNNEPSAQGGYFRLVAIMIWLCLFLTSVSAFNAGQTFPFIHPLERGHRGCTGTSTTSSPSCRYMEPQERSPTPPQDMPYIPSGYLDDMNKKEMQIRLFEKEIEMVRALLVEKQEELSEEKQVWEEEKESLMDRIKKFTKLLSARDEEVESRQKREEEYLKRQQELSSEILILKKELESKTKSYEFEVQTVAELKSLLAETQDALEYDQMSFNAEKTALLSAVDQEKRGLKSLEDKLKMKEEAFRKTKDELIAKVKQEEEKLSKAKSQWEEIEARLKDEQNKLMEKLREQEARLHDEKLEVTNVKDEMDEVRNDFQKKLAEEQAKVEETKEELRQEQARFIAAKKELDDQIKDEQDKIAKLQDELLKVQATFAAEKGRLEARIREEERRLAAVESELAAERAEKLAEISRLQSQLADQARVSRLKKRQMNERYEAIRSELTQKWEGAKRDARKEQARITKKYRAKIDAISNRVEELETDLDKSSKSNEELKRALVNMEQQKDTVIMESKAMEARYMDMVAKQKNQIEGLQISVVGLKKVIEEKDAVIEKYETSFRSLAKLSLTVTGNKLKRTGGRLKRLVQNSPPKELDE